MCVRVCACLNLTVVAKLSESCDNWSQMFESRCVVILTTRQTLESGCQKVTSFTCRVDKLLSDWSFRVEFTCLEQLVVFLVSFFSGLTSLAFHKSDL